MDFKILAAIAIVFFCLTGCGVFKNYTPDNPTEQFIEKVIEKQTGIKIDLSPWEEKDEKVDESKNVEKGSVSSAPRRLLVCPKPYF